MQASMNENTPVRNGKAPMIFDPKVFKAKRRSLGWTQKRCAEWFGMSAPGIGHWETGATVPWEKNWAKIEQFMELGNETLPVPVEEPELELEPEHPEWWPSATPETFMLRRNDQPKLRIKGWWLGSAEGQSPNGSDAEAHLYLTESGKTIVQVHYLASGKCYLTWGILEYVTDRMGPLPWAKQLVIDKGVDSWEDFAG